MTPRTRAIFVNSPSNPTGWTASRAEIAALLAFSRRHGIWIIADQVYSRFCFGGPGPAPGFHEVIADDDRVIFVNTFSKNWAMTGWRLGWIEAPAVMVPVLENMIQYSTSCSPVFVQRAAIAALEQGEAFVARQVDLVRANRDDVMNALFETGRVRFAIPQGAFYLFFAIDGETDTQKLAFRLVDDIKVGVAPGDTFGQAGAGFVRICLARSPDRMREATGRLAGWISRNRAPA